MQSKGLLPVGYWQPNNKPPAFSSLELQTVIPNVREPVHILRNPSTGHMGAGQSGHVLPLTHDKNSSYLLMSTLSALYPEWLGDRSFLESHNVRFPYIGGAMFKGITSAEMVINMARAKMLCFLGSAGMSLEELDRNLNKIISEIGGSGLSWGSNMIYMPMEPELEDAIINLYLKLGVNRISASAYMSLSPSIVWYSAKGLHTDSTGRIHRKNHIFAKISRPEVAKPFMEPAPKEILDYLVSCGKISNDEAILAKNLPVAEDITVEADSGGHTDNRPLTAIFPTVMNIRNEIMSKYKYSRQVRIGAAGGLGTPSGIAAAFAMGAAYVLTGSINQSAIEAGLSAEGKKMLSIADIADVAMAPAADMFEMGVKVQVLKRGTMFCNRAANLYQIYSENDSIENIPPEIKEKLEKEVFHSPLEEIWNSTRSFFNTRKPEEVTKAEKDPKYLMALVFRWYLGNSANWAINGESSHRLDYQICCGPSMGAFNSWVKGSFLSEPENRSVVQIALNLLEGAAVVTRAQQLRSYGLPIPESAFDFRPRHLA